MFKLLLLTQVAATFVMVGVIWYVQTVHYPLMARVPAGEFPAFENEHQRRTGFVVGPTMLIEAGTATAVLVLTPPGQAFFLALVGICLLVVIWLSTFLVQVPLHTRLASGFDTAAHRRLVQSNWLRTAAWSGRGILALFMLSVS